jgi:hypothetical protein
MNGLAVRFPYSAGGGFKTTPTGVGVYEYHMVCFRFVAGLPCDFFNGTSSEPDGWQRRDCRISHTCLSDNLFH